MTEPLDYSSEWNDVEALMRAAGSYVQPSEELRPRVLETARTEFRERWARRRIWQVALVVAILGVMSIALGDRRYTGAPFSASVLQVQPDVHQAEGGATGWNTVEAFTDLRRRQAALLSLTR